MTQAAKREDNVWTLAEAGFVLGKAPHNVKREVERAPLDTTFIVDGGRRLTALRYNDLVYLCAMDTLHVALKPAARRDFYAAIKQWRNALARNVKISQSLHIDLAPYVQEVDQRLKALGHLDTLIEHGPDGETWLKGAKVEVYRIGALLDGGMSVEAVLADYPSLTRDQVLGAKAFADAHPKAGRPYPKRTAKAAMKEPALADLDELLSPRQ